MSGVVVQNLSVEGPGGELVRDVDLSVKPGEILGLVGSSGAGKTLFASALAGLMPPPARVTAGILHMDKQSFDLADQSQMARVRGHGVFMIMQSASAALDPTMRIGLQIVEALSLDRRKRRWAEDKTAHLLSDVGLDREVSRCYPNQLSGGMRQRVQIAIALALRPALLIADEPTTGLDAITQAAILKGLAELPRQTGSSMIFISHDFKVVAALAENIAVLGGGRVVESGRSRAIFQNPAHDVTRKLVEASLD